MHRSAFWIHVCQKKKWMYLGNGFYIERNCLTRFVGPLFWYHMEDRVRVVIIKIVCNEFQASKRNISTQMGHDFWSLYEYEIIISREMQNEICSCYESKRVRLFATFLDYQGLILSTRKFLVKFVLYKNVILRYL